MDYTKSERWKLYHAHVRYPRYVGKVASSCLYTTEKQREKVTNQESSASLYVCFEPTEVETYPPTYLA